MKRVWHLILCLVFLCSVATSYKACDATNTCLNSDCDCLFAGVKLDVKKNCFPYDPCANVNGKSVASRYPAIKPNAGQTVPVTATMTGYFQVNTDGIYWFKLIGENVGATLLINNVTYTDAYFPQKAINSYANANLQAERVHQVVIKYFALTTPYSIALLQSSDNGVTYSNFSSIFYYVGELQLPHKREPFNTTCGSGVCTEINPNLCIHDCWQYLTPECPSQAPPMPLSNRYKFDDALGSLLQNQYNFRLPGVDVFAHGVNILTGDPFPSPIFSFNFCDNTSYSVVHNVYRGLVYTVPAELQAETFISCSYNTEVSSHSSSQSMAEELQQQTSISASADVSLSIPFGVGAGLNAAFSEEKSVATARSMKHENSGSLYKTEVKCFTSKIFMVAHKFHPNFLKDIALAVTEDDMLKVIEKYGSHFYSRAKMGGKLSQITVVDSSSQSTMSSSQIKQATEKSFGASVSAPVFKASVSMSESLDSDINTEQQSDFAQNSTKSTVLTYGGAPGAYGPSTDSSPSSFGDWASSVDLLPVPIEYKLAPIGNIIPRSWQTPDKQYVSKLWARAELAYYNKLGAYPPIETTTYYIKFGFLPVSHPQIDALQFYITLIGESNRVTRILVDKHNLLSTAVTLSDNKYRKFKGNLLKNIIAVEVQSGVLSGLTSVVIYEATFSKRYEMTAPFRELQNKVTLTPRYQNSFVVVKFSVTTYQNITYVRENPHHEIILITVIGTLGSLQKSLNFRTFAFQYNYEYAFNLINEIGVLQSVKFQVGWPRTTLQTSPSVIKLIEQRYLLGSVLVEYKKCPTTAMCGNPSTVYTQANPQDIIITHKSPVIVPLKFGVLPCTDCNGNGACSVDGCTCDTDFVGSNCGYAGLEIITTKAVWKSSYITKGSKSPEQFSCWYATEIPGLGRLHDYFYNFGYVCKLDDGTFSPPDYEISFPKKPKGISRYISLPAEEKDVLFNGGSLTTDADQELRITRVFCPEGFVTLGQAVDYIDYNDPKDAISKAGTMCVIKSLAEQVPISATIVKATLSTEITKITVHATTSDTRTDFAYFNYIDLATATNFTHRFLGEQPLYKLKSFAQLKLTTTRSLLPPIPSEYGLNENDFENEIQNEIQNEEEQEQEEEEKPELVVIEYRIIDERT